MSWYNICSNICFQKGYCMTKHPITPSEQIQIRQFGLNPELLKDCSLCRFNTGDILLTQGEDVKQIFLVLKGKIRVCMLAGNGKDLTLCFYLSQGILGDIELVQDDKLASATAVAALPSSCILIPLAQNAVYLKSCIGFMNQIATELARKLLGSSYAYAASALYSGEKRLCSYILICEHGGMFTEVLTDTAKAIGISYRQLFRLLQDLCQKGILEKTPVGFRILNRAYLTRS